ncbi:MAG: uridine kinase, partial [Oscillospiraceae bacterium]|nr:uridine kinase [Oscillospiraceae bacterium]
AMRDINERGRSLSSIVSQYLETVKPMYEKYVEPTKKHADIVLPNGGMNKNAIDMVANYLLDIVK